MPKNIPKPVTNWGIKVSKRNPITGKVVYCPDGSIEKTKILMKDGCFDNGEPQPLYFPIDHPDKNLQGKFKGMAQRDGSDSTGERIWGHVKDPCVM